MADFLVKRGGPKAVTLVIPTAKGRAAVSLQVTPHGPAGRISIPDKQVAFIDPAHAKHMVRMGSLEPALELPKEEPKTIPATPAAMKVTAG